jgi:uncharacterized protein YjbI with pentapeptide repeats
MPTARGLAAGVLGAGLAAALVALAFFYVPAWVVTTDEVPDAAAREALQNDVRTAALQLLAGLVLAAGAVFTARTYRLSREGHITERFSDAVEHLGHEDLNVRLSGIYALERIARDSRRDHDHVIEVLSAYLRVRAPWTEEPGFPGGKRADIAGAMDAIGRRITRHDRERGRYRLDWTDLREGKYTFQNYDGFLLTNAHLEGAGLVGTDFSRANLDDAHLEGVQAAGTSFRGAHLVGAYLEGANLIAADFRNAELRSTRFDGASLENVLFDDTVLEDVHLERATITGSTLRGATLHGAHLEGANLVEAELDGTRFEAVSADEATTWPPGFDVASAPG